MWDKIAANLTKYNSAVLTGLDYGGYPYSLRCKPTPNEAEQTLTLDVPDNSGIQPGPASLLCHSHDQQLWSLNSFSVRGTLERHGDGWRLRPEQFTAGTPESPVDMVRFLLAARKSAANYLKKRNLPRPAVNWDQIKALWQEAEAVRKGP